jgi:PBP1b-binding outer membrane lipoprotein LpoB
MKKLIVLLLILVVLGFSGCLQKTEQNPATNNATVTPGTGNNITATNTVPASPGTSGNLTISSATISSDIESISKEVASVDTNVSGNTITPINDTDLTVD